MASPFMLNGWYCAALVSEVSEKPIARRLLNEPVMIVRGQDGQIHIISDMCPHRFAPLHKGAFSGDSIECPYHGLRFDLSGQCIHNPHGDGRIPAAAKVRADPVEEREGVVWFWPGDPEKADRTSIPELRLYPKNGPQLSGHLQMPVDYRLIIDNLLDLSHAPFLHGGTLSPRGFRESKFEQDDTSIACFYVMRDVETPLSQSATYTGENGDYHTHMRWMAPTNLVQRVAMVETGASIDSGSDMRGAHLITPETTASSHYFWFTSRNRRVDDPELDERIRGIVNTAFMTEDEPMIEACQDYMADRPFFSLRPVYIETDFAGTRCRRSLEKLIAAENIADGGKGETAGKENALA